MFKIGYDITKQHETRENKTGKCERRDVKQYQKTQCKELKDEKQLKHKQENKQQLKKKH